MSDSQPNRFQQLIIRWVLVVVPTVLIGYVTLRWFNLSYTALRTGILSQTLYFALGLIIAYTLYYYRARWLVTFVLLWIVYLALGKMISRLPGEFDVFYATTRFQLYSTLFLFGWAFGFLLARVRWAYVPVAAVLLIITLVAVSNTIDISMTSLLARLLPVVVYGLYMFFLAPLLTQAIQVNWKSSGRLAIRFALFVLLVFLSFLIAENLLRGEVKAVEKELAARGDKNNNNSGNGQGGGYDDRHGLMENTDDGLRLKDTMRVTSRMSQSDKLMFCSKLDNYYEDGSPIPLYFVYHYLTRYDPVKETFTRDVNVPSLDEMDIDPAGLPLYYSYTDTTILRKTMGPRFRKVVEANVYLSENTWKHSVLGPSSVFSIQTIPVEKDFQKTFLSAYKILTYTSDLNNAYFVYNVSANPMLETIQEQRYGELRKIRDYKKIDRPFYNYYTQMPSGGIYDSIAQLAKSLVPSSAKPVDKVLAVRDFFLQRNALGKRVFKYTLKPGAVDDPNIPSSRMLYDFLFKTKAGYCTYYAGASHFMLRALGVPTRFTTGFATINRSDKNKGWYWFYASQAHAWTQVYFPEYGWLDFDMTIGNEEQQEAPKPDGTPPLPPPEPWLVLNAQAESVNTTARQLEATFQELIFQNTPYELANPVTRAIDASLCRIVYDKRDTTFAAIQPGDSLIIVSYKDDAKRIPRPKPGVRIDDQVEDFPSPIIADEIHIRGKDKKKDTNANKKPKKEEKKINWALVLKNVGIGVGIVLLLILISPLLYLWYLILRTRTSGSPITRADWVYRTALYRFHMAGLYREQETPLAYARQRVDAQLGTSFEKFMQVYLRLKYSSSQLQAGDEEIIRQLHSEARLAIVKRNGWLNTFIHYFNVWRASLFFRQPTSTEYETTSL